MGMEKALAQRNLSAPIHLSLSILEVSAWVAKFTTIRVYTHVVVGSRSRRRRLLRESESHTLDFDGGSIPTLPVRVQLLIIPTSSLEMTREGKAYCLH